MQSFGGLVQPARVVQVVEQMEGGIMWGPTGPEGKDEPKEAIDPFKKAPVSATQVAQGKETEARIS
jgi:hypothetical protein